MIALQELIVIKEFLILEVPIVKEFVILDYIEMEFIIKELITIVVVVVIEVLNIQEGWIVIRVVVTINQRILTTMKVLSKVFILHRKCQFIHHKCNMVQVLLKEFQLDRNSQ